MSSRNISQSAETVVVGVDGGGTRTRARLANGHGETLGNGEADTANPNAKGFDAALGEILAAIRHAFQAAGLAAAPVGAACFGIAGVDRVDERTRLEEWARQTIAPRVRVVNDGQIVLKAGSPEDWGIALIAGTGSFAWGKARDGRAARAGGWGYVIGDEGSGFDLAREALRAVTQAVDGRGDATQLVEAVLDYWHLTDPAELIPQVYAHGSTPSELARLAPIVLDTAAHGDPVARMLVARAAAHLADTVMAVARRLALGPETIPLALSGGLLLESTLLRNALVLELRGRDERFTSVHLVFEPVSGAVRAALELL